MLVFLNILITLLTVHYSFSHSITFFVQIGFAFCQISKRIGKISGFEWLWSWPIVAFRACLCCDWRGTWDSPRCNPRTCPKKEKTKEKNKKQDKIKTITKTNNRIMLSNSINTLILLNVVPQKTTYTYTHVFLYAHMILNIFNIL